MGQKVKIRKAKPKDVKPLVEMVLRICELEARLDPGFKALDKGRFKEFEKYIWGGVKEKKKKFVLVAEKGRRAIGFVYGDVEKRPAIFRVKRAGLIEDIYVAPKYRGKGIARQLVEETVKEFRKRKLEFVCLTALKRNSRALKAYGKMGFKEYEKVLRKAI